MEYRFTFDVDASILDQEKLLELGRKHTETNYKPEEWEEFYPASVEEAFTEIVKYAMVGAGYIQGVAEIHSIGYDVKELGSRT